MRIYEFSFFFLKQLIYSRTKLRAEMMFPTPNWARVSVRRSWRKEVIEQRKFQFSADKHQSGSFMVQLAKFNSVSDIFRHLVDYFLHYFNFCHHKLPEVSDFCQVNFGKVKNIKFSVICNKKVEIFTF